MKSLNSLLLFFFLFIQFSAAQTQSQGQAPSPLAVASVSIVEANQSSGSSSAKQATIQVTRSGQVLHLQAPADVQEGDMVTSAANQSLLLSLQEGSVITIAPATTLEVIKVAASTTDAGSNESTTLRIERGLVDVLAAKIYKEKTRFRVRSKDATMGVRGTEFVAEQDEKQVSLHTLSGKVEFYSVGKPNDVRLVEDGRASVLAEGAVRPTEPAKFNKEDFQNYLKSKGPGFKEQLEKNRKAQRSGSHGALNKSAESPKEKPQSKKKTH